MSRLSSRYWDAAMNKPGKKKMLPSGNLYSGAREVDKFKTSTTYIMSRGNKGCRNKALEGNKGVRDGEQLKLRWSGKDSPRS